MPFHFNLPVVFLHLMTISVSSSRDGGDEGEQREGSELVVGAARQGRGVQGPQAGAGEPAATSGNQGSDWPRRKILTSHWLKELEEARAGGKDVAEEAEEKTKKIHASIIKLEEQVIVFNLMHDWDSPHRFQFSIMSRIIFKPVKPSPKLFKRVLYYLRPFVAKYFTSRDLLIVMSFVGMS